MRRLREASFTAKKPVHHDGRGRMVERAEPADDPRLHQETVEAAKRAVTDEIVPKVARQIIGKALREAEDEVLRIVGGKFKNSAEENMVMRHKPLRAAHDEFLGLVGEQYGDWVGRIRAQMDDPEV